MVLQYAGYAIIAAFLYINLLVIKWDLKSNIIKNKFLWLLLCLFFSWILLHVVLWEGVKYLQQYSYLSMLGIFVISFLLSTFRVWWAWDAKYLFILYIFVWYISPLVYMWNIVVATFLLLIFLFIKNIIITNKNWIWLWHIMQWDIKRWKDDTIHKFQSSKISWLTWILNIVVEFFLFFLFVKVIRSLFLLLPPLEMLTWVSFYINPYIVLIAISIVVIILVRKYINTAKQKVWDILNMPHIEVTTVFNLFLLLIIVILLFFIYKDIWVFLSEMHKILTIYFFIHIGIRALFYMYKKCFIEMEKSIIHVNDLKLWDHIDKTWMKWRIIPLLKDQKVKNKHHVSSYTQSSEDIKEIQRLVKRYYKKEPYVNIINSFPYSPVIFVGFLLTYILESSYLFLVIDIIKNFLFQ